MFPKAKQSGQTMIELIVVITIGIIILSALVFAIMSSLRNAQFSKNQIQATKFAQEAIERIRVIRDRNEENKVVYNLVSPPTKKFSDLWPLILKGNCTSPCTFLLSDSTLGLNGPVTGSGSKQKIGENFERQIIISDDTSPQTQKIVTVIVSWIDFSGSHESKLTTILAKY